MAAELDSLLNTNIFEPLDPDIVTSILSNPPFLHVDGLFNLRDVANDVIEDADQPKLRQNYIFRSGTLEGITGQGQQDLTRLGIKTIIDLRSSREVAQFPSPVIDGVETVTTYTETEPLHEVRASSVGCLQFMPEMYINMLETHAHVWKTVLAHVRDHPDRQLLVHCTAGKDRTGVAVALILGIAGVSSSYIAREYALTRIGIEPAREFLQSKVPGGKTMDWSNPRVQALVGVHPGIMEEFLRLIEQRYGGVVGYAMEKLGFSEAELQVMRDLLRG